MFGISRLTRSTGITLGGLIIGIAGLLIQWTANPAKFGGFPPGIVIIAAFGVAMVLTARWWWHPIFAVLISLWIVVVGGIMADQLLPNLLSDNLGTVAENAVMAVGLVLAAAVGSFAVVENFRARKALRADMSST